MTEQPWTWKVREASERIKRTITRQDAHERVSGQAAYTRDISLPGMLYAKILTAPHAHAKIVSMDATQAEALVGVRDIIKYTDADISNDFQTGADMSTHYSIPTLPGISDFYQHLLGVAVVADSKELCDRALRLIKIEWEERPFILDMEEAAKPDAPKIMTEARRMRFMNFGGSRKTNPNVIVTEEREIGSVGKGFKEADKIIEYSIHRAMNSPAGVEGMACVAQWRGDYLDLWVHHQSYPQSNLSSSGTMGMRSFPGGGAPSGALTHWSKITVTFPFQGSWFGGLAWLAYSTSFVRLAAILARRAATKPVKLLYDESSFYCGGDEAGRYDCKVGIKGDEL